MRKPGEQPPPGLKLALAAPAIRGEYLKISSEMQEALAEAIATRTGTDLERDMYPRILAGAVIAAGPGAGRRGGAGHPPRAPRAPPRGGPPARPPRPAPRG